MAYIPPEIILEAKRMDLLTYLKTYEPGELVRISRNTYCTREHDSLKISNGKWMWWSRGIGGKSALDYFIKVRGMDFISAIENIMGNVKITTPIYEPKGNAYENRPLLLPKKSPTSDVVFQYLFGRGIDFEIIKYCLDKELIIESLPYHNVVFIGYDNEGKAQYGAFRATNPSRIMGDCSGSKKQYSFRLVGGQSEDVHLFECGIDLLSYASICKLEGYDFKKMNLISLSGVYSPAKNIEDSKIPIALKNFLEDNSNIKRIHLHLDNDIAGRNATFALKTILPKQYEVVDEPPPSGKDFNDFLCMRLGINRNKMKEKSFER